MDRRNLILSGLLVVQLVVVALLFWPNQGSKAAPGALVSGLTLANVTGVKVQSKTDSVDMVKKGDSWVLTNYGDYPVDTVKVTDLISKVVAIDTSRLVASTPSSQNRLQVADDDYVAKIDLATGDNVTKTLLVGASPSVRATNVRMNNDNNIYLSEDLRGSEIRTDVAGWIDLVYFKAPTADAQKVTIENANGKLDFSRVNTDTWKLDDLAAGDVFINNNFTTILTRLGGLSMVAPVGKEAKPEFGMDKPSATITVVTKPASGEGKTLTLTIGAKDQGGTNYYAKSSDSDYYVKVASFTGDQFVNDTRSRYLQPPTPAATSTITGTNGLTMGVPITSLGPLTNTTDFSPVSPMTESVGITGSSKVTTTNAVTPASPLATPTPKR